MAAARAKLIAKGKAAARAFLIALGLLTVPAVASGQARITLLDISAAEASAEAPIDVARLAERNLVWFDGMDEPLLLLDGRSWLIRDNALHLWDQPFPNGFLRTTTSRLPDGTVLGGVSPNHLRFIKRPGEPEFIPLTAAQTHYWNDHLDGSDIVFGKEAPDGPLLVLDGDNFVPSPIPELGPTRQGEFLPWYSAALGGVITAWQADLWFYRIGDAEWTRIEDDARQSWARNWGLYQRGSDDRLSPDGRLLRVISENAIRLDTYRISDGRPVERLPALAGEWYHLDHSQEIFGWHGSQSRQWVTEDEEARIRSNPPRLAVIGLNDTDPTYFPGFSPRVLTDRDGRLSFLYDFSPMPGTDRMYFLHSEGVGFYHAGSVTRLPAQHAETVGDRPRFLTTRDDLYVTGSNGVFHLALDGTLTPVVTGQEQTAGALHWDLDCPGTSVGFFAWDTRIVLLESGGKATELFHSTTPLSPIGLLGDGRSILFRDQDQQLLKVLELDCP